MVCSFRDGRYQYLVLCRAAAKTPVQSSRQQTARVGGNSAALIEDMCRYSDDREQTDRGLQRCVADQLAALAEIAKYDRGGDHELQSRCTGYVTGSRSLGSMEYVDANVTLACVKSPDRDAKFASCVQKVTGTSYDGRSIFWRGESADKIASCFNAAVVTLKPKTFGWKPAPYTGAIQPGYKGEDGFRVFEIFARNPANQKKDDFETTAQFDNRTSDLKAMIAPIDPDEPYAFKLGTTAHYDADKQVFTFGYKDAYNCGLASLQKLDAQTVLCRIAEHTIPSDSYIGENAFGAARQVTKIRGTRVSLTFPREIVERRGLFERVDSIGNYSLVHDVSVPIEKAALLRGKDLDVLLVGHFVDSKLVSGSGSYATPTISDPLDISMGEMALPFKPKAIVFYVVETGEILETVYL